LLVKALRGDGGARCGGARCSARTILIRICVLVVPRLGQIRVVNERRCRRDVQISERKGRFDKAKVVFSSEDVVQFKKS
jgi:hypothetical protein